MKQGPCGHPQLLLEPTTPVPLENTEAPEQLRLALQLPGDSSKDTESKSCAGEGGGWLFSIATSVGSTTVGSWEAQGLPKGQLAPQQGHNPPLQE